MSAEQISPNRCESIRPPGEHDDREAMDFLESLQRAVHGLNAGAAS